MPATLEIERLQTTYIKLPRPDASENRAVPPPPTNIVQNPAYSNVNATSVTIVWDDSVGANMNHVNLLLDDAYQASVTMGVETYTFTGLVANSVHNASIEAVNDLGIQSNRWQLSVHVSGT